MELATIREQWGTRHFRRSPAQLIEPLPLRPEDRGLLRDIGLPTGPKQALKLFMRFEDVKILHQPRQLRLVVDAGLQKGKKFPRTGHKEIDRWVDLRKFVVLGEAPNDYGKGPGVLNRLVCVDGIRGQVWWIYPKLSKGRTDCEQINSSLHGYLECLLAYKEFRGEWDQVLRKYGDPEEADLDREDRSRARKLHKRFLNRLNKADPVDFEDGFWFHHAWDEAILLES